MRAHCLKKSGLFFQSICMLLCYKMLAANWDATGDCGCCRVMWEKESKLIEDDNPARYDGGDLLQVLAVCVPRASCSSSPYQPGLISRSLLPTALLALVPQNPAVLLPLPGDGWIHCSQLPEKGELIATKWLSLFYFSWLFPSFWSWSPALQGR